MSVTKLCNLFIQLGIITLIIFPPIVFGAVQPQYVTYIQLIIGIIWGIWLIKIQIKGSFTYISIPVERQIGGLLILGLLNWFTSAIPHNTEQSLFLFFNYIVLLFLVIQQLKTTRRILGFAFLMTLIGSGEALFGIFQYLHGATTILGIPTPNIGTINATYMSHNHFAGFLIMILPVALGLLIGTAHLEKKFFLGLLIGIMGIALVLTLSRGGLLSFAVAVGFFMVCTGIKYRASLRLTALVWKGGLLLLVFGCVIVLYIGLIGESPIAHRSLFNTIFPSKDVLRQEIRLPLWKSGLSLVQESPLLGSGLGTFQYAFKQYRPPEVPQDKQAYHIHNDYLEFVIEMGLPGLFVLLWGIFALFRYVLQGYFRHADPVLAPLALGSLTGCAAMSVHSFFDFNLHLPANALVFTIVMAIAISTVQLMARQHIRRSDVSKMRDSMYRVEWSWKYTIGAICLLGLLGINFRTFLARQYLQLAHQSHYQGQLLEPIPLYQQAIRIDPYDPEFRLRLAAVYLNIGERTPYSKTWYKLSIREYDKAISLNRYNPDFYIRLGRAYQSARMIPQAIQAYQDAIKAEPHLSTYYEALGKYYLDMAQIELAMETYQQALRRNPARMADIIRLCQYKGIAYHDFQHSIPDDAETRKNFAALLAYQQLWEESKTEYRRAIELSGGQQPYYDAMLQACQNRHDDECMRSLWQELWERDPENIDLPIQIAGSFARQQQWEQAISFYQALLQQQPQQIAFHRQLAQLYQQQGHFKKALQVYNTLLTLQPDNTALYHRIATIHRQQNNWRDAIAIYQKALEAGITQADIYGSLGEAYLRTGDEETALKMLRKAVESGETRFAIYAALEQLYQKQRTPEALDLMWATYTLANRNNPDAILQLVRHHDATGEWLKAVTLAKELIAQDPKNVTYRRVLADLYEQQKLVHEAIMQWEKIVSQQSRSVEHILYLASLYEQVNEWDNARMQYRKILRIHPNHQQAQQRLTKLGG